MSMYRSFFLLGTLAIAMLIGLGLSKGLIENSRKSANKTYSLGQLGDIGVHIITESKALDGGKCPDGAEEVTGYGCDQGHARIWTSKLCTGANDAWGSKCHKECGAWALQQGNRSLIPVAKQARCYIPEENEGDQSSPRVKCPATRSDKEGGKCRCWVCLVKLEQ